MKKVITTVGTSFISNYEEDTKRELDGKDYLNSEKSKSREKSDIDNIGTLQNWAEKRGRTDISAEVSSLYKIQEEFQDDLTVYLISSDTIASDICARTIRNYFIKDKTLTMIYNDNLYNIAHLQVTDSRSFINEGLPNLINCINGIVDNYFGNVIFNITGGYKGVIPYLTILALINQCEIKYIFEDSNELITIPKLPVTIDESIFEKYYTEINLLETGIDNYQVEKNNNYIIFYELENKGLVERSDKLAYLSPIGKIFYDNYKSKYLSYYCPDDVYREISIQPEIKRIMKDKFFTDNRERKTERKGEHLVYDDGDNNNRIYYFQHNNEIYIYKTFQNEELARAYIDNSINKSEILEKSKYRRIER